MTKAECLERLEPRQAATTVRQAARALLAQLKERQMPRQVRTRDDPESSQVTLTWVWYVVDSSPQHIGSRPRTLQLILTCSELSPDRVIWTLEGTRIFGDDAKVPSEVLEALAQVGMTYYHVEPIVADGVDPRQDAEHAMR
jgi:hypothetical protein